jgi:hypothetical protein
VNANLFPIAKFRLGKLVTTRNAKEALTSEDLLIAIARHQAGDWGDLSAEDRIANDQSLIDGSRLVSAYHSSKGLKFWILTEPDRSVTTVLMPEDY